VVKWDTEVRAEGAQRRNMILIGGPITNMISADVNDFLEINFRWHEGWKIYSKLSKTEYDDEDLGVICKIRNPWDSTKVIILLAGLKFEGTKSCIIAITQKFEKLLKDYEHGDYHAIIRGLDRDGDGKVDDIEVIEIS
jgi:hypothetical protein